MGKLITLKISTEYMEREGKRWERSVSDWVTDYCVRNKISYWSDFDRTIEEFYLVLSFNSYNQRNWFARQGNKEFPYFEFC